MTRGSCLCGAVTYTVSGPLRPVIACHCRQCRKTSGHHVAATSAPRESVAIRGEVTWYRSSPGARRGFCPTCGSAGTLDAPTGLRIKGHIFCADRGDYYEIADGLPKVEGADPSLTTQVG